MTTSLDPLDAPMCDAISKATKEAFKTMFSYVLKSEERTDPSHIIKDITSMVGIAGDVRGMFALHIPEQCAFLCTAGMLGIEVTTMINEVKDAVGEMANIIIGTAKNDLYARGIKFSISTPTVIVGKSYKVYSSNSNKHTVLPFMFNNERFYLEFFVKKA